MIPLNVKNEVSFLKAWDQADYRLQRFDIAPKQINPNIAQKLIAELPPIASDDRVVFCDGGHPALGHPRVYINLVSLFFIKFLPGLVQVRMWSESREQVYFMVIYEGKEERRKAKTASGPSWRRAIRTSTCAIAFHRLHLKG